MTTVNQTAAPGQPAAPARDTFRLTLTINGTAYRVRPATTAAAFAAVKAFGVGSAGLDEWCHVAQTLAGNVCNCPAFRDNATCKHVRALVAAGLLDDARPSRPRVESDPDASLAEKADREADAYRALGTPEGNLFARTFEELALKIRMTQAATPDDYEGRIEFLDADIRERWEARGYEAGRAAGCRCGECPVD